MVPEKIYVVYAGSDAERPDLDEVAVQVSACLTQLQRAHEIVCAYDWHPLDWDFLEYKGTIIFLLDPYYETNSEVFDIRSILVNNKVPFTGPSIFASSKTTNKVDCKRFLSNGVILDIPDAICTSLKDLAYFLSDHPRGSYVIKPIDRGGGVDVKFIENGQSAIPSAEQLLRNYGKFMIEPYINGLEISVPLLRRPCDGKLIVFPLVSIILHGFTVFNEEAKKTPNSQTMRIPAEISDDEKTRMVEFSVRAYDLLQFKGLLRVDFLTSNDGTYFLEANSYPSLGCNYGISVPSARSIGFEQKQIVEWVIDTAYLDEKVGKRG